MNQRCIIYILCFPWVSFLWRSPQSIEQGSLCCVVGFQQLSILYIVSIVYICQFNLPIHLTAPFPFGVHTFVLYICFPIKAEVITLGRNISITFSKGEIKIFIELFDSLNFLPQNMTIQNVPSTISCSSKAHNLSINESVIFILSQLVHGGFY